MTSRLTGDDPVAIAHVDRRIWQHDEPRDHIDLSHGVGHEDTRRAIVLYVYRQWPAIACLTMRPLDQVIPNRGNLGEEGFLAQPVKREAGACGLPGCGALEEVVTRRAQKIDL